MTPFLLEMIRTRRLHAHVQSECVHTSAVKSTTLQSTKSQSATPSRNAQDPGPHQPVSTSTHVQSRAINTLSINTLSEMMSATVPSQVNVLHPLTLVSSAQRNETMLTSVTRDQTNRRREPTQYSYTACNPSASYSRGIFRNLCPVVVVASSPPSEPQLAALHRFNSTCCQSHAQPAHLKYAVLGPLGRTTITELSTLASTWIRQARYPAPQFQDVLAKLSGR